MRRSREPVALLIGALLALALAPAALAAKPPRMDQAFAADDAVPQLAADEALLAFAFDAESGVEQLRFQALDADGKKLGHPMVIKTEPERGYSVRVYRVRAASYRLEWLKAEGAYGGKVTFSLKDPFKLDAGQLNYIGDIKLKRHEQHVDVSIANHVGRFSDKMLESRRAMTESFKLRYAGADEDGWSGAIFEGR
jgi:hypothetical protein